MSPPACFGFNRRQIVFMAGAGLLSGCGSIQLIPQPMQPQLYVLRPQITSPMGAAVQWRLSIASPDAAASLDTTRIALSRSATTMDYFANAAWNDRIPLLVQRLLIQSFDMSNRIVAVDRDTTGTETDYLLETEIRDFEARYETPDGAPQIIVSIQAKLTRMPQRQIVSSLAVMQQARASANTLDSIVAAFDSATGAAIEQIAAWTLNAPSPVPASAG
jgi:cholesterol transport system auxiliary component